jgi:hypothetical protein
MLYFLNMKLKFETIGINCFIDYLSKINCFIDYLSNLSLLRLIKDILLYLLSCNNSSGFQMLRQQLHAYCRTIENQFQTIFIQYFLFIMSEIVSY